MNERLRELVRQAGLDDPDFPIEDWDNVPLAKFAKLIVEECINEIAYIGKANEVFGDRTDRGGLNHILWTTETAIEKIKQHFGVEE